MRGYCIIFIYLALSAMSVRSQSLMTGNNGFVVGQICTAEVNANATFGHFDNANTEGMGSVSDMPNGNTALGIENPLMKENTDYHVNGHTIYIDPKRAEGSVKLYNIDGHTVYAGKAKTITVSSGVYVLAIGKRIHKITVF